MTTANEKNHPIQVLIVDDDKGILWTLRELLEVYDFEVAIAKSGQEALEVLSRTEPACVLMDIVMPEQTGVEVFRQIKPLKPNLPVVFMTGYAHYNLEEEARLAGAADVIAKPIDMKYLVQLIEDLADRSEPPVSQPWFTNLPVLNSGHDLAIGNHPDQFV